MNLQGLLLNRLKNTTKNSTESPMGKAAAGSVARLDFHII